MIAIRLFCLWLMLWGAVSPCFGLEVTEVKDNEHTLLLSGQIEPGDLNKIVKAVSPPNSFPKYFTLDSSGGDVLEAMKIGHFIRETASGTCVNKTCASACVFILVGGVSKTAWPSSDIGLHRPYFKPEHYASLSLNEAEGGYAKVRNATRKYLVDMEVPTAYIEKMFSISSDDVYFLSETEKESLLVSPSAYSEWVRAKCDPPTAKEWELFKLKGFNIFDQFDNPPPSNPVYVAFISKYNRSSACEESLVADVREPVLKKYIKQ
ncbi:hypothetical protein [Desulforhopalus sp. IMCC35007]|uniref:COG3904 family protein n=1 Tax=Desulforhopalus sp. IMCC35007 TaxID=2569543 RepID=UPI0010AEA0F3|nr:hypothetical protein [Desulforhopalus sp. IMCC35007]TKB08402.1 hypothetical protein FCL48_13790 [Desulforhopalus sp. IMCC35007]